MELGTRAGRRTGSGRGPRRAWSALLALVLLVAACGDANDDGSGGESSGGSLSGVAVGDDTGAADGTDGQAAGTAADGGAGAGDEPTTTTAETGPDDDGDRAGAIIADLEEDWAQRRVAIVDNVVEKGWGIDAEGTVVTGPEGWRIDLTTCPDGWDDTAGVGDDRIEVVQTLPKSGDAAVYGDFGTGMAIYFDYVNRHGGIAGRQVDFIERDDGYVTTKTIEAVDDLLAADDQPFAVSTLGTANSLAVYDRLNEACVPNPFVISSHPAFGDPTGHPWTIGSQLSFTTEAALWGRFLRSQASPGDTIKVAALVIDNELGTVYEQGFGDWVQQNREFVAEFESFVHEPDDDDLSEIMNDMVEFNPDAVILMTQGDACRTALEAMAEVGLNVSAEVRIMPSVCKDPGRYLAPVGDAADKMIVVGGGLKSNTDPLYGSESFVAFVNQVIADAGADPANGLIGTGVGFFGWNQVEALRLASELPGGLRRSNLALALRLLDLDQPMVLDGIEFGTAGAGDGFPLEGSEFSHFDAEVGSWVREGRVVDVNGLTPSCPWGRAGCG